MGFAMNTAHKSSPLCYRFLCSVRSVGPLNRTSLHSPTQGAGGRETHVFIYFSYMSAMCCCLFSSINSPKLMSGRPACSRSKSPCPGSNSTPWFKTIIPSTYIRDEIKYLKNGLSSKVNFDSKERVLFNSMQRSSQVANSKSCREVDVVHLQQPTLPCLYSRSTRSCDSSAKIHMRGQLNSE